MPSGVEVAQAYITIIPSMKGIQGDIAKQLGAEKVGNEAGKKLGDGMAQGAAKSSDALMKSFSSVSDRIAFKTKTGLSTAFSGVADAVKSKMGGAASAITSRFAAVGKTIAGTALGTTIGNAFSKISGIARGAFDKVASVAKGAFDKVSGTVRGVGQFVSETWNTVAGAVGAKLEPIAGVAGNVFSRVGDFASKGFAVVSKAAAIGGAAAAAAIGALVKTSIDNFSQYEQLAGGAEKIFARMDFSKISADAQEAYKTMGLSANQYLEQINQTGAAFKATMGDEKGYETAKKGMQAISDYASGTGRNVDELNEKYAMITRSTSSYQSIADQFSGILPATSADFLEQAQAAGFLSEEYESLTDVPIAEYQQAVTDMLAQGTDALGLAGNTAAEAETTISGSMGMMKASWTNFTTELGKDNGDVSARTSELVDSVIAVAGTLGPRVGTILTTLFTQIPSIIQQQGPVLGAALGGMLDTVTNGGFSKVVSAVQPYVQRIADAARGLWERLQPLGPIVQDIGGKLGGIFMQALGVVTGAFEAVAPIIANIAEHALPALSSILDAVSSAFSALTDVLSPVASFLVDVLGAAVDWIGQRIEDLAQLVADAFGGIADAAGAVGDFLSDPLGSIKDFASGATKAFTGTADSAERSSKKAQTTTTKNYSKLSDAIQSSTKTAQTKGSSNMDKLRADIEKKTGTAASTTSTNMGKLSSSVSAQTNNAATSAERNSSRISSAWNRSYTTTMTAKANTSGAESTMSSFKNRWSGFSVSGNASVSTAAAQRTFDDWMYRNNNFVLRGTIQIRNNATNPTRGYMASGGIITHKHAAGYIADHPVVVSQHIVGEAGAEAVIPLTNQRYVAPFAKAVASFINQPTGGGVTITGNTFVVRRDSDIAAIGRAINQEAERRRRAML